MTNISSTNNGNVTSSTVTTQKYHFLSGCYTLPYCLLHHAIYLFLSLNIFYAFVQ